MRGIKKKLEFNNDDVLFHSSLTDYGKDEIMDFIGEVLEEESK